MIKLELEKQKDKRALGKIENRRKRKDRKKGGQKEQEVSKGRTGNKLPDFLSAMMEICLDNRKAQFPKETKKTTRSTNMKIIFYGV